MSDVSSPDAPALTPDPAPPAAPAPSQGSAESGADGVDAATFPDIPALSYEDAREELVGIVSRLEAGQAPLEDSMHFWRRGEALAAHCTRWLEGARAEIERAAGDSD